MTSRDASLPSSQARSADTTPPDAVPWVVAGVGSGVLGAAVVAVYFLVIDVLAGHPLATPNTLGAALFRAEMLPASAPIEPALVLGYTGIHGLVFLGFGLIGAFILMTAAQGAGGAWAAGLAAALFAAFEASFLVFGALFEPDLMGRLGAGQVALANALAAAGMALFLWLRDGRRRHADGVD